MLRRSLFVSALMLAGVVGFASSAKAVDQPTKFTATVNATCNLTAPTSGSLAGTLVLANGTKNSLVTGTPASVGIDCTEGQLSIAAPKPDAANPAIPTGATANYRATIKTQGGTTLDSTATTPIDLAATDNGDAEVSMNASLSGGDFAPGNYTYTVIVTATP